VDFFDKGHYYTFKFNIITLTYVCICIFFIAIIVSKWFMGDLLALAMGLMMAAQCLSSLMAQLMLPELYELANALWVPYLSGLISAGLALLCGVFLSIIDKKMD